jgi:hypothetical protein
MALVVLGGLGSLSVPVKKTEGKIESYYDVIDAKKKAKTATKTNFYSKPKPTVTPVRPALPRPSTIERKDIKSTEHVPSIWIS